MSTEKPESFQTNFELLEAVPDNPTTGRRSYRAVLAAVGRDRRVDDQPGHRIMTAAALKDATDRKLFDGLAMFVDHPGFFQFLPSLRNLAAITTETAFDGQQVTAKFTTYDNEAGNLVADLLDQVLADQVKPDIGSSMNLIREIVEFNEKTGDSTFKKFRTVISSDFVFKPGLNDARVIQKLQSIFQQGENNMDPEETPVQQEETLSPANNAKANAWLNTQRDTVINTVLNAAADLPDQVKQKLLKLHARIPFETPEELQTAIDDERATLAALRKDTIQLGGLPPRGGGVIGNMRTEKDKLQGVFDWLFGVSSAETPDWQFRNMAYLYQAITGDRGWHGSYDPEHALFSGADSTSLADLTANALNKVIIEQWVELTFYRWYEFIVSVEPNDGTVQQMDFASVGGLTTLPVVDEKASYTELDLADVAEVAAFVKYGGYIGLTLEAWRNSDIAMAQRIPRILASAAAKTRSAKIASLFTANSGVGPTLGQDSTALFHANHGNVATTALGTDTTAWEAASLAIFDQTEIGSGDKLGIFGKYNLVPGALYFQALKNFGYGDGNPTSYNPFAMAAGGREHTRHDPRPVVLAVPHFTDANDWAAVADPILLAAIHMSFAQSPGGRRIPPPEIFVSGEARTGLLFTNDTMPIKVRDWFVYGVNGYRGLVKRNVP